MCCNSCLCPYVSALRSVCSQIRWFKLPTGWQELGVVVVTSACLLILLKVLPLCCWPQDAPHRCLHLLLSTGHQQGCTIPFSAVQKSESLTTPKGCVLVFRLDVTSVDEFLEGSGLSKRQIAEVVTACAEGRPVNLQVWCMCMCVGHEAFQISAVKLRC